MSHLEQLAHSLSWFTNKNRRDIAPPIGESKKLQTIVRKMLVKFKETLEQLVARGESRNLIKSSSDFQTVVRKRKEKAEKNRQLQTVVRKMSMKFKESLE